MDAVRALPQELVARLDRVTSVGAITGAGVSCESGIRAYRGAGGLYDDPIAGAETVEALTGSTLARDPDRTWRALAALARAARGAQPNPAHHALAAIEATVERFVLLTQNVDGLHRAAGSRNVIDIHGDVLVTRCPACGREDRLAPETLERLDAAPACPRCDGPVRPDAVLFGEVLPAAKLARLEREFFDLAPDLVIVAGTTALFPYIVAPVASAAASGRLTVEINPEPTELSAVATFTLRGPAGVYLPMVAEAFGCVATPGSGGRAMRPDVLTLLCLGGLTAFIAGVFHLLWRPMLASFPPQEPAPDAVRRRYQSFGLGIVNMGLSVHVAADEEYLHLTPLAPVACARARPASIPWSAMTPVGKSGRVVRVAGHRLDGPKWCLSLAAPRGDDDDDGAAPPTGGVAPGP